IIMGKSTSDVDYYAETRLQYAQSLAWTTGAHQLKGGVDVNHLRDASQWDLFFPARIIFPSLAAFETFTPAVFWWPYQVAATSYPGLSPTWTDDVPEAWRSATRFGLNDTSLGLFVQDRWQAAPRPRSPHARSSPRVRFRRRAVSGLPIRSTERSGPHTVIRPACRSRTTPDRESRCRLDTSFSAPVRCRVTRGTSTRFRPAS